MIANTLIETIPFLFDQPFVVCLLHSFQAFFIITPKYSSVSIEQLTSR